jgi:hypothetical protein
MSEILNLFFNLLSKILSFFKKRKINNIFYKKLDFIISDDFEKMNSSELFEKRRELINFIENFSESEYYAKKMKKLMPGFIGFIDSESIVKEAIRLRLDIRKNKKEIIEIIEEFITFKEKSK